jgi:hypothetical protein
VDLQHNRSEHRPCNTHSPCEATLVQLTISNGYQLFELNVLPQAAHGLHMACDGELHQPQSTRVCMHALQRQSDKWIYCRRDCRPCCTTAVIAKAYCPLHIILQLCLLAAGAHLVRW